MKKFLGFIILTLLVFFVGCSKATTTENVQTNDNLTSTTNQTTTIEVIVTANPYCNCGFYQQRPFEISLSLSQILDELTSRGYYFVDYMEDYYTYFPEDLLALEERDFEWYNATVKYEEIITAYFDTDYGQLQIDIYQFETAAMASDLAHGYFATENCFNAVVLYSNNVLVKMFWYYEDLLNEWGVDPSCEGYN